MSSRMTYHLGARVDGQDILLEQMLDENFNSIKISPDQVEQLIAWLQDLKTDIEEADQ